MNKSVLELLKFADLDDPFSAPSNDLEPLWIDAINARFQECRGKIGLLDELARRADIDEVKSLSDVVPLLFAHSAYKSFPDHFIDQGRWDRMNLWLSTLSKSKIPPIDTNGIADADDWMARLHTTGNYVFATSGTSGKNSFLNQSIADVEFSNNASIPKNVPRDNSHAIFVLGPRKAPNRASQTFAHMASKVGRPEATYYLLDAEVRLSDLSGMLRLRKKIADATATPSEIADYESKLALKKQFGGAMMDDILDKFMSHRHEPCVLVGLTPQLFQFVEGLKARGVKPRSFHPNTRVFSGGGAKGFDVPPDHIEQIVDFLGLNLDTFNQGYGMQETSLGARMTEWGRYRFPAWMIPLLLDDTGEHLLPAREGRVTGRMALFDVSVDGRWGGIISGDRVTIEYETGPSGRPVPVVVEIARYSDLEGGDDKLTCAGTVESYVRGAVGE